MKNETILTTTKNNWTGSQWSKEEEEEEENDFITGAFLFTAILSFLGNLLVLILFLRNRKWLGKTYGRFIFGLAVVDILTAVCLLAMPLAIHEKEKMTRPRGDLAREIYCRLVWSHYILFSFGVTSVYTCLVLTAERWIAVAKPFYMRKYKLSKRSLLGLQALPWLAGFLLEANVVKETGVQSFQDGTFGCKWSTGTTTETSTPSSTALSILSFLGAMLLPALVITLLYGHILVKLRRENTRRQSPYRAAHTHSTTTSPSSSTSFYKLALRRTTKMAACATIAVILCWLPCQTYSLVAQLGYVGTETNLHRMLNLLAFFNSCINPFIYTFSNALFRKRFRDTFARFKCQNSSTNDNASVFV